MGLAIQLYANSYGGQCPDNFATLMRTEDILPVVFVIPGSSQTPVTGANLNEMADKLYEGNHISWHYLGRGLKLSAEDAGRVLIYEDIPLTPDFSDTLFCDGHTEAMHRDTLYKLLVKQNTLATTQPAGEHH